MSAGQEDVLTEAYKYAWNKNSDLTLSDFLTKFRPSMVENTGGTKPWIWVRGSEPDLSKDDEGQAAAYDEAKPFLDALTKEIESIKNDASIPARSSKKTGAKGKKEVREAKLEEAKEKLKDIAEKHGAVSGKWLIYADPDKVDKIWPSIANSLVSGPLSKTVAYLTKVSTSPDDGKPNQRHVILIYVPNVFDKDAITEVMRVLLRSHGAKLSGVKSNLYTALRIDSKHDSGIQSTTWKNTDLMKDEEIKELTTAFFEDLKDGKIPATTASAPANAGEKSGESEAAAPVAGAPTGLAKPKPKPKLVKKKKTDDPFGSDDDDEPKASKKPAPKAAAKRPASSEDGSDEDEKPKKKKK